MRTDLNSGRFTLYEILFSNTIVGIKTGLLSVSLSSLLDRFVYLNTAGSVQRHSTAGAFTGAK